MQNSRHFRKISHVRPCLQQTTRNFWEHQDSTLWRSKLRPWCAIRWPNYNILQTNGSNSQLLPDYRNTADDKRIDGRCTCVICPYLVAPQGGGAHENFFGSAYYFAFSCKCRIDTPTTRHVPSIRTGYHFKQGNQSALHVTLATLIRIGNSIRGMGVMFTGIDGKEQRRRWGLLMDNLNDSWKSWRVRSPELFVQP